MDEMGFQVPVGHKDKGEWLEQQALWSKEWWCGLHKVPVQMSQELSWYMQGGGLVEAVTITEEDQPTTSACLVIQTTSTINPEFNAPCAMCYASTMVAVTMLPAKTHCPSTWTLEYSGYLMSAASLYGHHNCTRVNLAAVLTYFEYNVKMNSLLFLLIRFWSQCIISHVCMCSGAE